VIGKLQKLTNKIELDALFFAVILIVSVRTGGTGLDGEQGLEISCHIIESSLMQMKNINYNQALK
jgi:hypothetical protein